jgi:hypothetical protein
MQLTLVHLNQLPERILIGSHSGTQLGHIRASGLACL